MEASGVELDDGELEPAVERRGQPPGRVHAVGGRGREVARIGAQSRSAKQILTDEPEKSGSFSLG